ncbi:MAG TPA: hydrogenase maturation protease [Mycobacteriales bacterium]
MTARVLVAGVGNVFLGDDGFGVEVANRLQGVPMPAGVKVADFGIRGIHLAYELLDGYDALILIDAVPRGEEPGSLYVIEPDLDAITPAGVGGGPVMDAHGMNPEAVLALLAALGGRVDHVRVLGCEPADVSEQMGLSAPVAGAVDEAVRQVRRLAEEAAAVAEVRSGVSPGPDE